MTEIEKNILNQLSSVFENEYLYGMVNNKIIHLRTHMLCFRIQKGEVNIFHGNNQVNHIGVTIEEVINNLNKTTLKEHNLTNKIDN